MTAINVIRQANAVHIVSDGALCDDQGIVAEIGPNAFGLPHLPAALAIRGSPHFMPFLVHRIGRECRAFDDLLPKLARTAYDVHISFPMMFGTLGLGKVEPDFELVVVGWSLARGGPTSWILSTHDRTMAGGRALKPWELTELPEVLIAPPINESSLSTGWTAPASAQHFRPEEDGLALLKAQRLSRRELPDSRTGIVSSHIVGGFVQLTSVTARGVNASILHWWPDEIGRKINPEISHKHERPDELRSQNRS